MAEHVDGDTYFELDGQLHEIKRQLRQKSGYPHDPAKLTLALQDVVEGRWNQPITVEDLIPKDWTLISDVPASPFRISHLQFIRLRIPQGELWGVDQLNRYAEVVKGCLGLADLAYFMSHQNELPPELCDRNTIILFPGAQLRWKSVAHPLMPVLQHSDDRRWKPTFISSQGSYAGERFVLGCAPSP